MTKSTVPYALVVDEDAVVRIDATRIFEQGDFRCFDVDRRPSAVVTKETWQPNHPVLTNAMPWKIERLLSSP